MKNNETKRTLFDISDDVQALSALLDETGGDITDEQAEQAVDQWLQALGAERDDKLNSYAYFLRSIDSDVDAIKAEIERLRARKSAMENKAARLKARLQWFFESTGIERIQTPVFTFAIQKNGGKPRVILSEYFQHNPQELPEPLRRVKFEPDLDAIRTLLESDAENNQALGHIAEQGRSLRIK